MLAAFASLQSDAGSQVMFGTSFGCIFALLSLIFVSACIAAVAVPCGPFDCFSLQQLVVCALCAVSSCVALCLNSNSTLRSLSSAVKLNVLQSVLLSLSLEITSA